MSKKRLVNISVLSALTVIIYVLVIITYGIRDNAAPTPLDDDFLEGFINMGQENYEYEVLVSLKPSEINGFTINYRDKESVFIKTEEDTWIMNKNSEAVNYRSVSYALNTVADIKMYVSNTLPVLEATEENLSLCGFDNAFTLTLKFENGEQRVYSVGNYQKFGSAYYFTIGDGKIYTVQNRFTKNFIALID